MKHIYDNQNGNHKSSEERFTERFKEVAENYEPIFEPADWSAMQSKLAVHNKKNRKAVLFRRLAVFATMGTAAIILLFGGYQFLSNSLNNNQNSHQNIAFQNNSVQNSIHSIKKNTLKENIQKNTQNFTKTISKFDSEKKLDKNSFTQKNITHTNSVSKIKSNQIAFSSSSSDNHSKQKSINLFSNNKTIQELKSNKIPKTLKLNLALEKIEKTDINLFANIKPAEISLPELEIEETLLASNQNNELIRKNPVVSAIGKWRIGAALMAITNIYKNNDKKRMNYANGYGVMADYQLSKRFNISSGAIYTQKKIDIEEPLSVANITHINPNEDTWVKKNKTKINWQLIDLPIHLRYNAIQTDRNKWFLTAGTSNYFLLKENYESDYTVSVQDIYDPRLTRSQEVVSQKETQSAMQLFTTINVSIGLETSLGKHLTLQVEPYWKFPVRSLGSEGVFVQTGGLLTRINFAL